MSRSILKQEGCKSIAISSMSSALSYVRAMEMLRDAED